jgi:malonyl-CoA O-methyltransferase
MPLGPGTSEITPTLLAPPRMPARVATVSRQFGQRARRLGAHDALLREIGVRMIARLEVIRLAPRRILDVGCGFGRTRAPLAARYPDAEWTGVELAPAVALAGRAEQRRRLGVARLWRSTPGWIVADGAQLPVAADSVDLLFSNAMVHWHPAPHSVFPEWKRVLRVDGLLMFSCFGPDTLRELRAAVAEALPAARPMPFVDMHDFGDMMVSSGFATPVMDVEHLTLTYESPESLLAEVRALGANPRDDRPAGLPGGRAARRLRAALDERRGADGRIALTFEVAYGHAWKPAPRTRGETAVSLDALRAQLAQSRPGAAGPDRGNQ